MPQRGEDVLCYQCNNVFPKDEHGLTCPRCSSDFTEIIEGSAEEYSPAEGQTHQSSSFRFSPTAVAEQTPLPQSPRSAQYDAENPFLNHNPWAETRDDETQHDGNGPRVSRHSYRSPDGRITFTSTTFTSGMGGRNRNSSFPDPTGGDPILQTFGSLFQELAGAYNPRNRNGPPPDQEDPWETQTAPRGAHLHGGMWPRNTDSPPPPAIPLTSLNDIFDLLGTGTAGDGFDRPRGGIHIMGTAGMGPLHPLSLLATMLGGGRIGDAVYSQEELDRVISQLVDQNMNQGAPPAAEASIRSLPKKIVDKELLGGDEKGECSICMETVELGREVTVLPCKHWFHGECIEMWLKQHNTCPHCRRPIDEGERTAGNPAATPSAVPQSPSQNRSTETRETNRDYSGNPYRTFHQYQGSSGGSSWSSEDLPSEQNTHSAQQRREQSDRVEREGQSQAGGGGVTGWLRSHFGGSN